MKFGTHVLCMNTPTPFFIFSKFPPVPPLGRESPPKFSPEFFSPKYCPIFMKFGTHVLCMNTPTPFFHFFEIPPIPPLGGGSPPEIPHLEIPSDCLEIRYICSVPRYLTNAPFSFPKFPPISPPPGGEGLSPRNSKISKFTPIVLKLGMYVLWRITRVRVLSVFRNSPPFPPGGGNPLPHILHLEISFD